MGACASGHRDVESKVDCAISSDLKELEASQDTSVKILLLGAAESGKSTVFKQMRILYGKNQMTQSELTHKRQVIHDNIFVAMQTILDYVDFFGYSGLMREDNKPKYEQIMRCQDNEPLTVDLAKLIRALWVDPSVMMVWVRRSETQIVESIEYFVKHLDRIARPDYMNKSSYSKDELDDYNMDILRARVPTKGITTEAYTIDGTRFEMYDVCGQRNERRKWIECFNNVTAVIFVAALSEYDQKLSEDRATNRMLEALELFDQIVKNRHFAKTSIILFLNKRDIFESKITRLPIKNTPAFSDYKGGSKYSAACDYFKKKFLEKIAPTRSARCIPHFTCATDTKNIHVVFELCKTSILFAHLRDAELM